MLKDFISQIYSLNGLDFVVLILVYLIGSISPSIMIGKMMNIDIKKEGSGNAGTTNTLRVMGKKPAIVVLVLDVLKGTLPVLICKLSSFSNLAPILVIVVVLGHIYPIYFKFKGGKGVATAFGAVLGYNYLLGLIALFIVGLIVMITKRMSMAAIGVCVIFPIITYFVSPNFVVYSIILAILIICKHKSNIERLIAGNEPKIRGL